MGREMTVEEARDFLLTGTRTAKLAFVARDGAPRVTPVWFVLDDAAPTGPAGFPDVLFNTGADTAKGRALRRDPRVAIVVDDDTPPFAVVRLHGTAELIEDLDAVRSWATRIGGRYMGPDRADEFGRRNGVPGEYLVRVRIDRLFTEAGVAD
jgi:PPOX class probable F420-dependent enzyme